MQFLVAPVKWTNTMAIKRLFEDGGVPARIVGAGNVEAALSQLKKNDRYHAVLIDWEEAGAMGLELACAIKERGQPVVVAFQNNWGRDDIRRALQLGVDSLLLSPFSPEELVADLRAVREKGTSLSRERLLQSGGEILLDHLGGGELLLRTRHPRVEGERLDIRVGFAPHFFGHQGLFREDHRRKRES